MATAVKPKTDRWYDTRNLWLFENRPVMWLALNKHRTHRDRPISLQDRPYLRQLYMSTNPYVVVKKSTQCGVSEWLTVCTFAKAISGRAVFYVLPTWQLIGRFVKNRVDRSIQFTEFYRSLHQLQLLRQQKYGYSRPSESMSLKHFGPGVIAYAGSNTTAPFTEFPADDVIIDELDECDQGNLHMAWERMSASEDRRQLKVGNPTIEGYGIDAEYTDSKQYEWHIECECGELVHPDWFKHVVRRIDDQTYVIRDQRWKPEMARDVHMVCHHCERPLPRMGAGKWLARFPQKDHAGYHISKLFSTTVTVRELVERFEKGLVNDDALQRFYNGDLGQAYTAPGAKISEADLRASTQHGGFRTRLTKDPVLQELTSALSSMCTCRASNERDNFVLSISGPLRALMICENSPSGTTYVLAWSMPFPRRGWRGESWRAYADGSSASIPIPPALMESIFANALSRSTARKASTQLKNPSLRKLRSYLATQRQSRSSSST